MKGLTDEQLMEKYCEGEVMAFELLYQRHKSRVWSYLKKRVKDEHAVNEIFQGIFMKLHRKRDLYSPNHLFIKWLYTICRSELSDYFRKTEKFTELKGDIESDAEVQAEENRIDLDNFSDLSANEKKAIELKYYSDKDYEEISEILKTSNSNARKLVSRGIKKLRLILRGDKR